METQTEHRLDKVFILFDHDSNPDVSYLEQPGFEQRRRQYQNGLFHFGGLYAVAKIDHIRRWPHTGGYQYIGTSEYTSAGLWGIESDSDQSYLDEIATEQLAELLGILHEQGYTDKQISEACDFDAGFIFDNLTETTA